MSKGVESGAWYHDLFLRHDSSKLKMMKRVPVKGVAKERKFVERVNKFVGTAAKSAVEGSLIAEQHQPRTKANTDTSGVFTGTQMFGQGTLFKNPEIYRSTNAGQIFNDQALNSISAPVTAGLLGVLPSPIPVQHPGAAAATRTHNEGALTLDPIQVFNGFSAPVAADSLWHLSQPVPDQQLGGAATVLDSFGISDLKNDALADTNVVAELYTNLESLQGMIQNVCSKPIRASRRRHGLPCLATLSSADRISSNDDIPRLGIKGRLDVQLGNRDVSDVEFDEFLAHYFN